MSMIGFSLEVLQMRVALIREQKRERSESRGQTLGMAKLIGQGKTLEDAISCREFNLVKRMLYSAREQIRAMYQQ